MPFRCASGDYTHNEEPTLDALLGEPTYGSLWRATALPKIISRQLLDAVLKQRSLGGREHGRLSPGSQGPHFPTD